MKERADESPTVVSQGSVSPTVFHYPSAMNDGRARGLPVFMFVEWVGGFCKLLNYISCTKGGWVDHRYLCQRFVNNSKRNKHI